MSAHSRVRARGRVVPAIVLLACALAPRPAAAEGPVGPAIPPARAAAPAAPRSTIVPPHPLTALRADYPAGGQGNHTVMLHVTVNADGTVREARVVEGADLFAEAAVTAARQWRFEPATKGGAPIAAIVRVRIDFSAPGSTDAPTATGSAPTNRAAPSGSAAPPDPADDPSQTTAARPSTQPGRETPLEVLVRGERLPPAVTSFTRSEVRLLPGAFGDPFRAIESMPGVTPIVSGLPFFYIRGAPPGNAGYYLDGIRVPLLYHIGLGPSVIHPVMVERVDLYPGGYPATFGRHSGGIVAGETRPPATDLRVEGSLRLVDAGALLQTPFSENRGSALFAGRYSYTAALASLASSNVDLDYWDYQGRVSYDFTPRDKVTAFFFGSYDFLGEKQSGGGTQVFFSTEFHRLDLRYDAKLGVDTTLQHALTLGVDRTGLEQSRFVLDRMVALRTQLHHRISDAALLRAGTDVTLDLFQVDLARATGRELADLFPERRDLAVGASADMVLQLSPAFEVIPGARVDLWSSAGVLAASADARLATRALVSDRVRLVHALGLAHQPPSFILPGPGLTVGGLRGGLQRSVQTSAGVEADLPLDISASMTFFFNGFFNMSDALGTSPTDFSGPDELDLRSFGSSVGMELYARRRLTRRLGGYLSYTLSRSTRTLGRSTFPARFDRTHVASAAATYSFDGGWRTGTRLVFYTGVPDYSNVKPFPAPGVASPGRLPPFFRFDARIEKRWEVGDRGFISLILDVLNATLAKEVVAQTCRKGKCKPSTIGPVTVPSVGVEAGF